MKNDSLLSSWLICLGQEKPPNLDLSKGIRKGTTFDDSEKRAYRSNPIQHDQHIAMHRDIKKCIEDGLKTANAIYYKLMRLGTLPKLNGCYITESSFQYHVSKVRKELNLEPKNRRSRSISLYREGLPIDEIADQVKAHRKTVRMYLIEAGLIKRNYQE